mgnify:CR=1 FL=1
MPTLQTNVQAVFFPTHFFAFHREEMVSNS